MAAVGDSTGVELVAAVGSPAVAAVTQAGEAVVGDAVTVAPAAAAAAGAGILKLVMMRLWDLRRRW